MFWSKIDNIYRAIRTPNLIFVIDKKYFKESCLFLQRFARKSTIYIGAIRARDLVFVVNKKNILKKVVFFCNVLVENRQYI